jgi:hypothetical protein
LPFEGLADIFVPIDAALVDWHALLAIINHRLSLPPLQ